MPFLCIAYKERAFSYFSVPRRALKMTDVIKKAKFHFSEP
jgi:hypothetical protein